MTTSSYEAPAEGEYVVISFDAGVPCALDGEKMSFHDIILKMNEDCGSQRLRPR